MFFKRKFAKSNCCINCERIKTATCDNKIIMVKNQHLENVLSCTKQALQLNGHIFKSKPIANEEILFSIAKSYDAGYHPNRADIYMYSSANLSLNPIVDIYFFFVYENEPFYLKSLFIQDFTVKIINSGYGSHAMEELISYAKSLKVSKITGCLSWVDLNDHEERLYHFYKKHGFTITDSKHILLELVYN